VGSVSGCRDQVGGSVAYSMAGPRGKSQPHCRRPQCCSAAGRRLQVLCHKSVSREDLGRMLLLMSVSAPTSLLGSMPQGPRASDSRSHCSCVTLHCRSVVCVAGRGSVTVTSHKSVSREDRGRMLSRMSVSAAISRSAPPSSHEPPQDVMAGCENRSARNL